MKTKITDPITPAELDETIKYLEMALENCAKMHYSLEAIAVFFGDAMRAAIKRRQCFMENAVTENIKRHENSKKPKKTKPVKKKVVKK